jgi:iron complex outermembrane receptor protein
VIITTAVLRGTLTIVYVNRYDVLNASVDWSALNNGWGVRLWGRNLTGQHYCVFETATTLLDSCAPASPRTYGITLSAHF